MIFKAPFRCVCTECRRQFLRQRNRGNMTVCTPCQKKARLAAWCIDNAERRKELRANWFANNPDATRNSKAKWAAKNPDVIAARQAEHRARKRKATPSWADRSLTRDLYSLARIWTEATGTEYHVDHVIPLNSQVVCGLHWHENLQILPAFVNRSKSNKLEGNP